MSTNMNEQEPDALRELFRQMGHEPLSSGFNDEVMHQIMAEVSRKKKREERLTLLGLGIASVLMVGLAVAAFYYCEVSLSIFRLPAASSLSFCLFICLMVIILLTADHKLRQVYYRKHAQSQS